MSLSFNRRYYLAFVYPTTNKVGLHCTHCFFGTSSNIKAREIGWRVDSFFRENGPIEMPRVVFNRPATFINGRGEPKRVLLANSIEPFAPFGKLWDYFAERKMMNTKYAFQPHVTTPNLTFIDHRFAAYALIKSGFVIRSWSVCGAAKNKAAIL